MEASGPGADVACECTQAHHCIKQSLNVTASIGKPGATKLVMEQYSLFTHLASECTQISIA